MSAKFKIQNLRFTRKNSRFPTFIFEFSILLLTTILFLCFPVRAKSEPPKLTQSVQNIIYNAQQKINKKDYGKAEQILKEFITKHPQKPHYLLEFTLGYALTMAGKDREALLHYQASTDLYPDYVPAWQNMGKIYFDLKQYDRAGDCLLKVYELNEKNDPSTLYHASASYIMAKKERKALPHLEHLLSGEFGSPKTEWLKALLNVYINLGLKEKAFRVVRKLLEKDENNPSYWKLLAHLYLQQNNYKKGVTAFTIYSYLNPLKREEMVLLGDLNQAIGLPLKAAEYYEKVVGIGGDKISDYEKLASTYLAGHRPERAKVALERALNKGPNSRLWFMMGQVLYEEEKFEEAYCAFKKSAVLNDEDGECYLMMGYCALQTGKKSEAGIAFKKAAQFPRQRKMARKLLKQVVLWKKNERGDGKN